MAKSIDDKQLAFGLIGATCAAVSVIALPFVGAPGGDAIWYASGSAVVHVAYNIGLTHSYRLGAFSHTYPLARGTSPLLVAAGAWLLAGERLDGLQIAGVATVAVGLMALVFAGGRLRRADMAATAAALATGVTIARYSLVDGLGVRHSQNALGYIAVLFALQGPLVAATALVARRGHARAPLRSDVAKAVVAGLLSLVAYGIVIWAQTRDALAVVSALRETSVIVAAVIGAFVFKEDLSWNRLPPAVAVVAGVVMINL
jgi:drug/metabolite transporter (DMT)-like permease